MFVKRVVTGQSYILPYFAECCQVVESEKSGEIVRFGGDFVRFGGDFVRF